jgi:putative FmdB family regulatory protein
MPIYEYQCDKCGVIEVTQRITEKALAKCPTCKSKVKRLISNTSFQLKGTGWYITDYARKGQTNGESKSDNGSKTSSSESKSDSSSKSSSSSESKSESKKTESKKGDTSSGGSDKSSSPSSSSSTSA